MCCNTASGIRRAIILNETLTKRILSFCVTFVWIIGMIWLGIWTDSQAMQWLGAIIAFLTVITKALNSVKRLSFDEARAYLDELEAKESQE